MSPISRFFFTKVAVCQKLRAYETYKSGLFDSCRGLRVSDSDVENVVQINQMMNAEET